MLLLPDQLASADVYYHPETRRPYYGPGALLTKAVAVDGSPVDVEFAQRSYRHVIRWSPERDEAYVQHQGETWRIGLAPDPERPEFVRPVAWTLVAEGLLPCF